MEKRIAQSLAVSLLLFLSACSDATFGSIEEMTWLEGSWQTVSSATEMTTREVWNVDGQAVQGEGSVIRNGETGFVEKLTLKMIGDTLTYIADVPENSSPIHFKLTTKSAQSWTFENPTHDFPKSIQYIKNGEGFEAVVSGDDRSFTLKFIRN